MARVTIDPLSWQVPIVDKLGRPTPEFQRKFNAQRDTRSADADDIATALARATAAQTAAAAAQATANEAAADVAAKPDSFLDLEDTPNTYAGQAGKFPKVNADENGLEFDTAGGGTFLSLTDTPSAYTGEAGKFVKVNGAETALEFAPPEQAAGTVQRDADRYGPPVAANFPTIVGTNAESPTVTDTDTRGMVIAFGTSPAVGDNVRCVLKAKAAGNDYSIIARLEPAYLNHNYLSSGLVLRDSTSGELVTFGRSNINSATGTGLKVSRWTSPTAFSSDRVSGEVSVEMQWLRIDIVGGDWTDFYVSQNGTDWIKVLSESQTAFLTVDQVGFYQHLNRNGGVQAVASTQQMIQNVLYYSDPDITPVVLYPGSTAEVDMAATILAATDKATPVDADLFGIVDSAAANVLKKLTWANLKATLKAYFDPLYVDVAGDTMTGNLMVDLSDSIRSQIGGTGAAFTRAVDSAAGPINTYNKARGALSAQTAAQQNDVMARLLFQGYDGAAFQTGAEIRTTIREPTPGAAAMGSEIEFRIAPIGSSTPTAAAFVFDIANGFQMGGSIVVDGSRHFAPRSYTVATLPAATTTGRLIWCSNLGGGAGLLEADGTNWKRVRCDGYQEVSGTGNFNLTWLSSAPIVAHTAVLAANRNCTLLTTNAYAGARYRISRHGADAFALNVVDNPSGFTLKPLSSGDWVEVTYNGANWYVSAFGSL